MSMADQDGVIWMDGELVPWREAKVHVLTHTLHYGMGVFEGVRAYKAKQGTAIFRLPEHTRRLYGSAHIMNMPVPWEAGEFAEAHRTVVRLGHRVKTSRLYRRRFLAAVNGAGEELRGLPGRELTRRAGVLREALVRRGLVEDLVVASFALVRELSGRCLKMRHYDSQMLGGWVMLNGMLAEMETGEGKTLTATLPACTAAMAGIPVHVITVNDYLAKRDADLMAPLYKLLGLTVASVTEEDSATDSRRRAYSRCAAS